MGLDFASLLGGAGGGGGYGSGPSAATADASSGINNQAAFYVGGSGSGGQTANQTAAVSSSPSTPGASAGISIPGAVNNTVIYLALGVVGIIAVAAVLKR